MHVFVRVCVWCKHRSKLHLIKCYEFVIDHEPLPLLPSPCFSCISRTDFWLGLISFQCCRAWRKSITGAQQSISQYSASPQAGTGAGGSFYCVLRCVWVIFYASTTRTRETIKPHENCPFLSALTVSAPSPPHVIPSLPCVCVIVRGEGDGGRPIKRQLWLNSAYARRVKKSARKSIILPPSPLYFCFTKKARNLGSVQGCPKAA